MCVACVYCFSCESDALVSRATRWYHKTLNVRLPVESVGVLRCRGTSVKERGESIREEEMGGGGGGDMGVWVLQHSL